VTSSRILELLLPFLSKSPGPPLTEDQLTKILTYLDLLLRWNARINLTAIRDPEEIITRHFGESLFTARHVYPKLHGAPPHVIDVGSGAGFPGLPIKLIVENARVTLIESNRKKATFLREVIRALRSDNVEVFAGRAETFGQKGDLVVLRAVEHFEVVLPTAISLMKANSAIALLIGVAQEELARGVGGEIKWSVPIQFPESTGRILQLGYSVSTALIQ
jgi:16S rRNA (guanine527-N7)-methyltransferase